MKIDEGNQRIEDAALHDDVLMVIGEPDTGRSLMTLSVTKGGTPTVESANDEDLAAGIRALNTLLSEQLVAAGQNGMRAA